MTTTKEMRDAMKLRTVNRIHELDVRHRKALRFIKARAWGREEINY